MQPMIRPATTDDVPTVAEMIRELAEYEHLSHEVLLDEDVLGDHLFGDRPYAEVLIAESDESLWASHSFFTTTRPF